MDTKKYLREAITAITDGDKETADAAFSKVLEYKMSEKIKSDGEEDYKSMRRRKRKVSEDATDTIKGSKVVNDKVETDMFDDYEDEIEGEYSSDKAKVDTDKRYQKTAKSRGGDDKKHDHQDYTDKKGSMYK